ncbi:MAG: GIY-YIG nuclease family protein [Erysipelotrichaceae bacterium]
MINGKNVNTFVIKDNDYDGRMVSSIPNWTGRVFGVPRTALSKCNDFDGYKHSGVYLLLGANENTGREAVYIGQAGTRKNGKGLLNRLIEHNRDFRKDYWTEAILLTTVDDTLGPTDISYLEHKLTIMAIEAGRYEVMNGNEPSMGNISFQKENELKEFIENFMLVLKALRYRIFDPLVPAVNDNNEEEILYCKRKGINATGRITAEGFVVRKGSVIASNTTNSCPLNIIRKREEYSDKIKNNVLQEDILFASPSGAACFVTGASANGNGEWKNAEGVTLKELESN